MTQPSTPWDRLTLEAVLRGLRSEEQTTQVRAITASVEAMLENVTKPLDPLSPEAISAAARHVTVSRCQSCGQQMRGTDWADRILAENAELRAAVSETKEWLIWSNEHRCWWGPNRSGYNVAAYNAGRYTLEEAREICYSRSWEEDLVPPETMIHIDSIPERYRT